MNAPIPRRRTVSWPTWARALAAALMFAPSALNARAAVDASVFEQANRRYEEGAFAEAASLYEQLVRSTNATSSVYLNLGNAYFKSTQPGRAVAAYLRGLQLDPRDPGLRFNLQFVRRAVAGDRAASPSWLDAVLTALTLNEWAGLAAAGWWVWLGLLCLRECRPAWRRALGGYTATAGALTLLLAVTVALAVRQRGGPAIAVVAVPEAVVRNGPLEVSEVKFQLRDGSEAVVLDMKRGEEMSWVKVRDAAGREGWMRREEVALVTETSH